MTSELHLALGEITVAMDDMRLYDAAQRHQVLLFTCQRERWTGLGVAARELRSFVTSTSASTRATAKSIITSDDL